LAQVGGAKRTHYHKRSPPPTCAKPLAHSRLFAFKKCCRFAAKKRQEKGAFFGFAKNKKQILRGRFRFYCRVVGFFFENILQIKYYVVLLCREYLQSLLTMLKCAGLFILYTL